LREVGDFTLRDDARDFLVTSEVVPTKVAARAIVKCFQRCFQMRRSSSNSKVNDWVEPLKSLQRSDERDAVVERIIAEYPERVITPDEKLLRLRKRPTNPSAPEEYDSPPTGVRGAGRFESDDFQVLYASQDLEVCIHECRVTVEDELYLATLKPRNAIQCLDLTTVLKEDATEFESLDMAVHMLFLAGAHSYPIWQAIARGALKAGFDGVVYPSDFSLVRTGAPPFETVYGLSVRRFDSYRETARALSIPNLAVFGQPVTAGVLAVECVNKLVLRRVAYDVHFGPVGVT